MACCSLDRKQRGSSGLDARDIFASLPEHWSLSGRGGLENLDLSNRNQPGTEIDGVGGAGADAIRRSRWTRRRAKLTSR